MNKFKFLFKKISKHELISGSFFIFLGTTFSSFLAFILNLFFARNLTYADYGVLATLLSLFNLAVIPALSLNAIIIRFASRFVSLNEMEKVSIFLKKLLIYFSCIGIVLIVLSFILSPIISSFLNISDKNYVIFMAIIVAVNYLFTVNIAFLNSLLKFKFISFSSLIGGIFKLLVGVVLVYYGFRIYGALTAIFSMVFFQLLISFFPLKKLFSGKNIKVSLPFSEIFKYSLPTSVAILASFSFVSTDVVLVKHFFNEDMAGLYGGLSLVGRVIFYFTLPVPSVMFPLLVKRQAREESYKNLLYLALVLVSIPSLLITIFYFIFPELSLKLFLGGKEYLQMSRYLGLFAVFLTIFSITNVLVNFYVSLKDMKVTFFIVFFAFLQIILIYSFHQNFLQIILSSIFSCGLLLLTLLLYYIKRYGFYNIKKSV